MPGRTLDLAAASQWLSERMPTLGHSPRFTKFADGQSNPTYRLDTAAGTYVLRARPMGELLPSAHAIDREHRLLRALRPAGFPVPRAHLHCEDASVAGAAFYLMDHIAGTSFTDGTLPSLDPEARRALYLAMTDTLAQLHAICPETVGLADFGRPGSYFERQVSRWTRQYRASQTDTDPAVEALIEWLAPRVPRQTRTTIVHGDYRIDNLIFGPSQEVRAVLDWELSTLGDPLADLSYFALQWVLPSDRRAALAGHDLRALGIPPVEEIIERYAARSGIAVEAKLDWYFAFNLFRLIGIVQGIKRRMHDGNASSAHAGAVVQRLPVMIRLASRFAERAC